MRKFYESIALIKLIISVPKAKKCTYETEKKRIKKKNYKLIKLRRT